MNKHQAPFEILGWYGVLAILGAYVLLTFGLIASTSTVYQLLNLTGSAGIVISAWKKQDWQPVALNLVWLIVALIGLATALFKQ